MANQRGRGFYAIGAPKPFVERFGCLIYPRWRFRGIPVIEFLGRCEDVCRQLGRSGVS